MNLHKTKNPNKTESAEITGNNILESIRMIKKYSRPYSELFCRSEQRGHLLNMITGLTSNLERKSVEPIATMYGVPRNPLQHFVGCSNWSCEPLMDLMREEIKKQIGIDDGVLVFDGSATQKKATRPLV